MPDTVRRVPGFAEASPARRPAQAHAVNENAGDTLRFQSLNRGRNGDQNVWCVYRRIGRPSSGIDFVLGHWSTYGKDGFTHIMKANGRGKRRLTLAEKRKHKRLWTRGAVSRLRKANGQAPVFIRHAIAHAKSVGFLIIPELKDARFALAAVARAFVAIFRNNDYACWPKALTNLARFKGKVYAFGEAGVIIGAIGGKKGQAHKRRTVAQARAQRWRYQPHSW